MANKGSSGHIKRLNAPKYFAIHKKEHKYTIKPDPGRHSLKRSLAVTILIEKLGLADDRAEANRIVREGNVSVNGRRVYSPKFPVGLNDIVTIGSENYAIGINNRSQISIAKSEGAKQVYKVIGKYKSKGDSLMIRLHDGRTMRGGSDANVDDSVVIAGGKISKVMKLDSGAKCEVIDGVHVGTFGTIKTIAQGSSHRQKSAIVEPSKGEKFETLVRNIIVVE